MDGKKRHGSGFGFAYAYKDMPTEEKWEFGENANAGNADKGKEKPSGQKPLTLLQFVEFAEKANIPFRIDSPGFTRIAVDFQEQLKKPFASIEREIKLGINCISF